MGAQKKPTGPRVERLHSGAFEVKGLRDLSPEFKTRRAGEIWLQDQLRALPLTRQPQVRACLCCGADFRSEGAHHRMCNDCRSGRSADTGAYGFALAGRGSRKAAGR